MKELKIPKEVILEEVSENIIKELKEQSEAIGEPIVVEKVEWTAEGITLWIQSSN